MKYGVLIFVVAFALVYIAGARAASHDTRLDAVASAVAGHPVVAVCADNDHEWVSWEDQSAGGAELDGFTQITVGPNIYLAPRICNTLEADLQNGPSAVGDYWLGLAIKTIIHESVHQRGITDESVTDCTALTLVKQYAVSSFGFAPTVTRQVIASKKVKGKRVLYVKQVTVPNPALADLYAWALAWHRALPANYQGAC